MNDRAIATGLPVSAGRRRLCLGGMAAAMLGAQDAWANPAPAANLQPWLRMLTRHFLTTRSR